MIIGISGKPRRGKDTLAQCWAEQHDYHVLHWAYALRQELSQPHDIELFYDFQTGDIFHIYHVVIDGVRFKDEALYRAILSWWNNLPDRCAIGTYQAHDWHVPERLIILQHRMQQKARGLLQWWGVLYRRRHFGENYWIDRLSNRVDQLSSDLLYGRRIAIPDTRFPNEAAWIREQQDGYLVRVEADQPFEPEGGDSQFISETALDTWVDWDAVIRNDYDEEFFRKAELVITRLHHGAMAGALSYAGAAVSNCFDTITI